MKKTSPYGEKRSQNCHHMEKRVAKRLSTMKNPPPPHGEINVAALPPFYFTIFILQQMLYISWIFVLASHSTNIFLLFTPPPTALCGRYSPFLFSFSRGAKPPPHTHPPPPHTHPPPPTMDKRMSAHPLSFCMYSVSIAPSP